MALDTIFNSNFYIPERSYLQIKSVFRKMILNFVLFCCCVVLLFIFLINDEKTFFENSEFCARKLICERVQNQYGVQNGAIATV